MKNRIVLIICILVLLEITSCQSYMDLTSPQEFATYQDKSNVQVLQVQTNQYSIINFSEKFAGRISNAEVIGIRQVLLDKSKYDSLIYKSKGTSLTPIYAIKDNVSYKIVNQDYKNLVCFTSDTIRIPFSDITQMHIKETDYVKSLLLFGGVAACAAGLIYLIAINITFDLDIGM